MKFTKKTKIYQITGGSGIEKSFALFSFTGQKSAMEKQKFESWGHLAFFNAVVIDIDGNVIDSYNVPLHKIDDLNLKFWGYKNIS